MIVSKETKNEDIKTWYNNQLTHIKLQTTDIKNVKASNYMTERSTVYCKIVLCYQHFNFMKYWAISLSFFLSLSFSLVWINLSKTSQYNDYLKTNYARLRLAHRLNKENVLRGRFCRSNLIMWVCLCVCVCVAQAKLVKMLFSISFYYKLDLIIF